ncbi:hypothetical protein LUZ62_018136 [Rhynchospora pubera]|uniref:Uncharacterized protein n=1 Tax=Rhynchospora pubera TaxID=906938 RepID=A0AAV8GMQ0_9POAL|nr:hypothetical protein LUZ62_018136 [Rhynchospora pubera]
MRKNSWVSNSGQTRPFSDRLWLVPFLASLLVTITLLLACAFGLFAPFYGGGDSVLLDVISLTSWDESDNYFVESDIRSNKALFSNSTDSGSESDGAAPRIAYLITGTKGDGLRIRRTLQAVYHPRNQYILHLDLEAPPRERIELAMYVKGDPTFSQLENVRVIAKGNLVTYKGPTMIACTLHAVSILLKENLKWDWFINLSASDYPLMTQDDILHVFSTVPRNLNFIEHMKIAGWKVVQRARPIVIDPGLYLSKKFDLVTTTEKRELPTSFELYTGSAWVMLTRSFLDYCIWGWDQLPRTLLMYYANFISSPEGYFHTVICNTHEFQSTVIGHDLHYIAWDYPPKQHPLTLSSKDYDKMVKSGAPFARKFARDDKVLDRIDRELLQRSEGQFTPGAWCAGESDGGADPCSVTGNDSSFRPGPGAERLKGLMAGIMSQEYRKGSCSNLGYDQSKRKWINRTRT